MQPERTLCAACGYANEAVARFCGGCARPITRIAAGAGRAAVPSGMTTPAHLAQRILASRGAIEGERKLVTVMFADVIGSMELIAGRDPEQAQAILDAMLREMVAAVHRYEGTVSQVLGDGLMALFGAPIAHEDHAVRAACAALAIQDAVRNAREGGIWRSLGAHVQVRIGLNSGLVVIKAIENDLSIDYRAVGATTHLASRMEQIAPPGSVRLTRETLRLAEGLVDAEPLGRIAIKGIAAPVEVYELRRMTPGGTRFLSRVTRGLTPLVGRAKEMQLLTEALRDAARGNAQAVALHGEPGVGKSRLCYEVMRAEAAQPFRVLETAGVSYNRGTPYSAIVALLGQVFGITESESADALRRRVQSAPGGGALPEGQLAILQGLLDIPGEDDLWQRLDPAQRKQQVFAAVRTVIRDACERQPVILIWEDLHWFDGESLEFVEGLLRDPPGRMLLMLLTGREEISALRQAGALSNALQPLPPELTDAMLRSLLGEAPELDSLRALLTARTYGNPFFIEETVRSLIESGVLVGDPGRYALREPNPTIDIPPTAAALIAARIDALVPEAKALVQTAAVIGNEMAVDVLRRVSGLEPAAFAPRLTAAVGSGLMYEQQHFPSTLCGFRHALNQEVAYGSLLSAQRSALHGRVVEAFEEIYRERISEHVERLAEHSFRAELWEKCVRYHIMAAARAATRFANDEAVQILDRGLSVVERLAPGKSRSEAAIDLRLAGLAALLPLGEHERILSTLFEAEALVAPMRDPRRLAAVHSQISYALWLTGQHERSRDAAERALAVAKEQKLFGLGLSARFGLVQATHALGDLQRCSDLAQGLVDEITGELEGKRLGWAAYPSVLTRTFLGSALTLKGDFPAALRHLERGLALADATHHPMSRALVRHELGTTHFMRGDTARALQIFEEAIAIAHQGEVRTMYAPLAGWRGATLAELGRVDEAIETIEEVIDTRTARLAGHYAQYFLQNGLASAYARAGRLGEALSRAEEAVDRTLATQEFAHHGHALLRLAAVQAERGAPFAGESEGLYRRALAHALKHGMRPLAAESHEGLGRLSARRGAKPAAREALQAAAAIYAELGLAERAGAAGASAEQLRA